MKSSGIHSGRKFTWILILHEIHTSRWRHQMETFSTLLAICAGNSPVSGEFPTQRPVTRSFDVFFDLHPNERLSKHSWGWWLETQSSPLWRHSNVGNHSHITSPRGQWVSFLWRWNSFHGNKMISRNWNRNPKITWKLKFEDCETHCAKFSNKKIMYIFQTLHLQRLSFDFNSLMYIGYTYIYIGRSCSTRAIVDHSRVASCWTHKTILWEAISAFWTNLYFYYYIETDTKWLPFCRRHFNCTSLSENCWLLVRIPPKCVSKRPNNISRALVHIMAWRRTGSWL